MRFQGAGGADTAGPAPLEQGVEFMAKHMTTECEEIRGLLAVYPDFEMDLDRIGRHFAQCRACRNVRREHLRVKRMLREAVNRENIPQVSIDRIRSRIRG